MDARLSDVYALQTSPAQIDEPLDNRRAPLQVLQAQRARGFRSLRFQHGLEGPFRRYMIDTGRNTRLGLLVVVFFLALMTPLYDVSLLQAPLAFARYAHPLQYAQLPFAILAILVVWFRPYSAYADALCVVAFLVVIASILAQRAIGAAYGFDVPLEFVGVGAVALLVLSRTRFWYALPWVVFATAAMVLTEWLLVQPQVSGYYRVIACLMLVGMACFGGYAMEYYIRDTWLNSGLLNYLSHRDGLTDLLNRRALEQAMEGSIAHARRERCAFGVAMIDIDYFKAYNDAYGHQNGDAVICRVAQILRGAARRPQDFCGRYGGEEFVVVWVDGKYDELRGLAEQLRADIEQSHMTHAGSLVSDWVTVSIGLYWVAPEQIPPAPAFLPKAFVARMPDAADERLYEAKFGGRNRVVSASARL